MLNVWIGNLGKYNEGELVGEWLSLPVTDKELENMKMGRTIVTYVKRLNC